MKASDFFRSLHNFFDEKRFVVLTISLISALFLIVLFLSKGFTGGSETIWNFNFARFAFTQPQIFFNGLSKPLFTALSSPFTLAGIKGLQIFNIIVGIVAGYFSYLVARELKMKQPILAAILCCFTPIFAYNMFSGYAEILFALATIIITYLYIKDKYYVASIILSFLPLIRFEGIFLIPIYAIFVIYKKQYRSILLMFLGILVYYIIGFFIKHDFLWILNQLPHKGEIGIYGKGSFFQFVKRSPGFFGIPNEIFYVTGLVAGITLFLRDKKELSREFLLVFLPFITYFFVHSFMWWSGIGNSQGSNRYMAAIVPLMAVMSTRGLTLFSLMFEIIFKRNWARTSALYIGIISVIHIPFAVQNYPIHVDSYNKIVEQASDWVKQNGYEKNTVYFMDANFPYKLGKGPFEKPFTSILNIQKPIKEIEKGSIIIYDEKYFPTNKILFDSLIQNHNFKLIKVFEPESNFKFYGRDYRIAIFESIEPDSSILNQNRMVAYGSKDEFKSLVSYDFDRNYFKPDSSFIYLDDKNDTKCLKVDSLREKYLYREFDLSTISFDKPLELYLTLKINYQNNLNQPLLFVTEVNKNNNQTFYKEITLSTTDTTLNAWSSLNYRYKLPDEISFSGTLKLYFLNRSKKGYLIDDYQIGYCYKRQ